MHRMHWAVIAAAGNDSTQDAICPARIAGVLSIGASTESDGKASFSNYGSLVALAAPGSTGGPASAAVGDGSGCSSGGWAASA